VPITVTSAGDPGKTATIDVRTNVVLQMIHLPLIWKTP
jgi:hypothetical protein